MSPFQSNKCPKCHGYLYLDKDSHDWFQSCLQCGHRRYLYWQRDPLRKIPVVPQSSRRLRQTQQEEREATSPLFPLETTEA